MWLTCLIAFNLGLFSSLHCVGMCGGIITALMRNMGSEAQSKRMILNYSLVYNLGRISSYSLAGLVAGLFGEQLAGLLANQNAHLYLQVVAALVLLLLAFSMLGLFSFTKKLETMGMQLWRYLQPLGKHLYPTDTKTKAFLFGMVWGWLPCGLVYSALLLSLSAGTSVAGLLVMLCFGLGTLPAMLSAGYFVEYLQRLAQQKNLRIASAILLILMALSLPFSSWYFSQHHAHHSHEQQTMDHSHHHSS